MDTRIFLNLGGSTAGISESEVDIILGTSIFVPVEAYQGMLDLGIFVAGGNNVRAKLRSHFRRKPRPKCGPQTQTNIQTKVQTEISLKIWPNAKKLDKLRISEQVDHQKIYGNVPWSSAKLSIQIKIQTMHSDQDLRPRSDHKREIRANILTPGPW